MGTEAAGTGAVNPVQSIDFAIARSSHEEFESVVRTRRCRNLWIVGLALIALMLKLMIAFNTVGTNDAVLFFGFAKVLSQHGLEWAYRHSIYLNHPPLIAYYLRGIYTLTEQPWCQDVGVHFPFLLRLPGIIADFLVVLVLLRITKTDLRIPTWALALFALSPVSLMVSGFHGNTDPVMVMFLMLAAYMCLRDRPLLCAIFFALSCQIKIIPLLLLPILVFFWLSRQAALRFTIPFMLLTVAMWIQPLIRFPMLFLRNVLGYSSYWGVWGITYWLRLTHWGQFYGTGTGHLPPAVAATTLAFKCSIAVAVLLLAWRRRLLDGRGAIDSIAYAWMTFFVFSPGIGAQYMVWLAPFALLLSPSFYAWVTATSSLFLFAFYNAIAGGLPWYLAISSNNLEKIDLWAPWSLWPWATLILGLILLWKKAIITDSSLRLFSLRTLGAQSAWNRDCNRLSGASTPSANTSRFRNRSRAACWSSLKTFNLLQRHQRIEGIFAEMTSKTYLFLVVDGLQ